MEEKRKPGRPRVTPEHRREMARLAAARWRAANPERLRELRQRSEAKRDPEARRRNAQRQQERARQKLDALKSRPCADCGVQYPPYVMQFDHRDPAEKSFGIGRLITRAWDRMLAEIAKCDVVCANCHAE